MPLSQDKLNQVMEVALRPGGPRPREHDKSDLIAESVRRDSMLLERRLQRSRRCRVSTVLPVMAEILLDAEEALSRRKEEWIGDAVLMMGLRLHFSLNGNMSNKNHMCDMIASNAFLRKYAKHLKIEGGEDEIERRFWRVFNQLGRDVLMDEIRLLVDFYTNPPIQAEKAGQETV